jgi:hypothetical protein
VPDTVAVALIEASSGQTYPWTTEARMTADELDFLARAADVTAQPPLLLVSGERDTRHCGQTRLHWSTHYASSTRTQTTSR